MGRPAAGSRTTARIAAVVCGALFVACKANQPASAPMEPGLHDDIAEIEARLEHNADALEEEGIYVARAPAPGSDAGPQPVTQQPPEEESAAAPPDAEDAVGASEPEADERSEPASDRPRDKSRPGYWSRWLAKRTRKKDDAERCQRICDLAEATCELADRICELAQRHPDEVRYEEVCDRAEHHCRVAAEACTACAG
jgi:hypothetical protein